MKLCEILNPIHLKVLFQWALPVVLAAKNERHPWDKPVMPCLASHLVTWRSGGSPIYGRWLSPTVHFPAVIAVFDDTTKWQKYAKMFFVIKFKEFSSKSSNLFHFFPRASPLVGGRSPLTQLQLEKGHVAGPRSPVFGPNASQIPHPRWQKGGLPMKAVVSSSNKNTFLYIYILCNIYIYTYMEGNLWIIHLKSFSIINLSILGYPHLWKTVCIFL